MYFDRVARIAVPAFADFCLIYLLDGDALKCVASAHRTREGGRLLRALTRVYRITRHDPDSTVAQTVRRGRPHLRTEIRPESAAPPSRVGSLVRVFELHRQLAVRSALTAPIEGRAGVIGALALSYSGSGRQYVAADVLVAEQMAHQLALAADNGRLLAAQRRQEVLSRRARPALSRLRHAVTRLRAADSSHERTRLVDEVVRQERMLARMIDRCIAACPAPARRASRLRART